MLIDYVYKLGFSRFRSDRRKLAEHSLPFQTARSILDLGGYPPFWQDWKISGKVVCLNVDESVHSNSKQIVCIVGDGCNTGLEDRSFDICFSNSVIEHVGNRDRQQNFADEVRRLAPSYWVQTPNRHFFIETHLVGIFIHWLPRGRFRRFFCRYCTLWGLGNKPSNTEIDKFLTEITLLSVKEMQELFPDATILRERFLLMTKSIIAYKTDNA